MRSIVMDNEDLHSLLEKWLGKQEIIRQEMLKKFPPNPPNKVCNHAYLKNLSIENSFKPCVGDYNYLFETPYEKIYVWTHTEDKNSALISEVSENVKGVPFWKNIGSIIQRAIAICEAFEQVSFDDEIQYKWIYYFEPSLSLSNTNFYEISEIERNSICNGRIVKATFLSELAPIIDILLNNDKCYTSLSLLLSSFQIHSCCLNCELSVQPWRDHLSHEPELWEHANMITKMESAVVQACRSTESILGEPPNRNNHNAIIKHKSKWIKLTGIDPDSKFEKANITFLEFYYTLFFELRNPSAHSYGNIHFDLERSKTIQAQCFAAIILREYIIKNKKSDENAIAVLKFNTDLLKRVDKSLYTSETK